MGWNKTERGTYNTNSQIKFKTLIIKSSLCDYSDAYILASGTITVPNKGAAGAPNNRKNIIINKKLCSIYWLRQWNK